VSGSSWGKRGGSNGRGDIQVRRGAKARITTGESVLLVRERHADDTPFWTLPGGGVRTGESLEMGLRREVHEELGSDVRIHERVKQVLYAHHSTPAVSTYAVFDCSVTAPPRPNPAEGVLACRWFDVDALPPRVLPQVRTMVASG
jgi:8-oxo-dGTP diphosphatase